MEYSEKFYKKQDAEHIRRMAERIAELEAELAQIKDKTRIEWYNRKKEIEDGYIQKIKELEAELARRYCRHTADVEERDRKIGQLREDIKRLEAENAHLRACLKRLEWCNSGWANVLDGTMATDNCPICDGAKQRGGHGSDCWLAKELKEGE